jgi:hypothetical protein
MKMSTDGTTSGRFSLPVDRRLRSMMPTALTKSVHAIPVTKVKLISNCARYELTIGNTRDQICKQKCGNVCWPTHDNNEKIRKMLKDNSPFVAFK